MWRSCHQHRSSVRGSSPLLGILRGRVETVRARIEPDGGEVDVRLFLTFMDQSGTTQRRELDRKCKEADAIADKVISSSAIYDDDLDAIEERVEDLRDAD